MKTIIGIVVLALVWNCTGRQNGQAKTETVKQISQTEAAKPDHVEVLYFHGKQRCVTCRTIEQRTREVLDDNFADAVKAGKIVFREINISEKEGEKIADQYEVTWSSLFVNQWKAGKEKRNNLTEFAFGKAISNTEEFKEGLKTKIKELIPD